MIPKDGERMYTFKFDTSNDIDVKTAKLQIELIGNCAAAAQDDDAQLEIDLDLKFKHKYKVKRDLAQTWTDYFPNSKFQFADIHIV